MSASYCFVLHGRCIAPLVRDSIFAEHQRPQVAAFMECVDFMQPRWPSGISTLNSRKRTCARLFVAQAFDGVEAGCADCRHHPADDAHQTENNRGHNQAAYADLKVNVSRLEAVAEGAHEWQRT